MSSDAHKKLEKIFLSVFKDIPEKEFILEKERNEFESWDSLTHLQLVSEVETAFGVNFEMDEIVEIQKPADFIALIEKKHAK